MTEAINLHLGAQLKRRRRLVGMTQEKLASFLGIRFQQIQKYETGSNKMSAARVWELANALEVPVGYFFEGLVAPVARNEGAGE